MWVHESCIVYFLNLNIRIKSYFWNLSFQIPNYNAKQLFYKGHCDDVDVGTTLQSIVPHDVENFEV